MFNEWRVVYLGEHKWRQNDPLVQSFLVYLGTQVGEGMPRYVADAAAYRLNELEAKMVRGESFHSSPFHGK